MASDLVSGNVSLLGRPKPRRAALWWELRRAPWISLFIIFAVVFVAVFAPVIAPYPPNKQSLREKLLPPAWQGERVENGVVLHRAGTWEHPLGTDILGRDSLSRLFYGARVSLIVAAFALLSGGAVGGLLGVLSGYVGGKLDALIMRAVDATLAFPTILFALLLAVTMGQGLLTIIIAITLILWARFARVIRGEVLALRTQDYIALARLHGCSDFRIMLVHILPNIVNTLIVMLTLHVGLVILTEASLSFLGAGIPPPTASWGQMVADGRTKVATAWWISIVPGAAITLVVIAFNLFGDWLRDRLDPKLRQLA
ncbi:MAG: ABC transporter permease [Chloroflexi bacterium]|nr:ABC transporter permease [Chloroflexota bacterium]